MITTEKVYNAAIYCRLSQDDGTQNDSVSITTQKSLLTRYCSENNFIIHDYYIDDGWSGTNFERPEFRRMIEDIESGKVNLVIVKDLSRFGREYAMMGVYINYTFEDYNVRFIAVTDGVDTLVNSDDLVMPIKNVVNAQYARETGRKTRAARMALAKDGKFIGSRPPYGYIKDPSDRHHLVIDDLAAKTVRRIFELYCNGIGFKGIAKTLRDEQVLTPQAYSGFNNPRASAWRKEYDWHITSVKSILTNREYTGCIVNCREQNKGAVKKKRVDIPEEEQIIVGNTHEPIISNETYELTQSIMRNKYRPDRNGETQMFSGLVKCSTCGSSMNLSTSNGRKHSFVCWVYRNYGKERCTSHSIGYNTLYYLVLNDIRVQAEKATYYKAQYYELLLNTAKAKSARETKALEKEISKSTSRLNDVETVSNKLYEDYALGKLPEERYRSMNSAYETERSQLEITVKELCTSLSAIKARKVNADNFIGIINKYTDITELNAKILNELIDKIIVYDKTEQNGEKAQNVVIRYKFVGEI